MADNLLGKVASLPVKQKNLDTTCLADPVTMQVNVRGEWEKCPTGNDQQKEIEKVIQMLCRSSALSAPRPYCTECAQANKRGDQCHFLPIIMMPINSAGACPFNSPGCLAEQKRIKKMKAKDEKDSKDEESSDDDDDDHDEDKKPISAPLDECKEGPDAFKLQRFTDFELMSQW